MMETPEALPPDTNTTSTSTLDMTTSMLNEQLTNLTSSLNESLKTTHLPEQLLSPAGHYAIGAALAIIGVVGIAQNSTTFIVLNKRPKPQRVEFLVKILLMADLFVCMLSLPFAVTSSFARRWLFGDLGCKWYGFSTFFLGVFTIEMLTAISIERYITMNRILQHPSSASSRMLYIAVGVSTLGALVWSILPLVGVSSYKLEGVGTSCSVDWHSKRPQDQGYLLGILICCFIIPLSIIITTYSLIYRQVTSGPWSANMVQRSHLARKRIKMEVHLAKTICLAGGAFLFAWSPYAIISLVAIVTDREAVAPIFYSLPALFGKCSVFGNSLAYVFMNRELRHACLRKLGLNKSRVAAQDIPPQNGQEPQIPIQNGQEPHNGRRVIALEPREPCPNLKLEMLNISTKGASKDPPQHLQITSCITASNHSTC